MRKRKPPVPAKRPRTPASTTVDAAKGPRLTERQRRFVENYNASGNATESARKAGYKYPDRQGPRLLGFVGVAAAVAAAGAERRTKTSTTARERRVFWARVLRDEDQAMRDRLRASELAARAGGDFIEKIDAHVDVDAETQAKVTIYLPDNGRDPPPKPEAPAPAREAPPPERRVQRDNQRGAELPRPKETCHDVDG